ncbi:MAG: hypothetical protein AB7U79_03730 [Candidatus Izemoplasmatales bacterium]
MNYLRDFYEQLNQSENDRFARWKEYRLALTSMILPYLTSSDSCFVGAVGNADDIDLEQLNKATSNLTLADIDEDAINRGVQKYHLDGEVKTLQTDFTNLSQTDLLEELYTTLILAKSKTDIDIYMEKFEEVFTSIEKSKSTLEYDVIILLPIYTQMLIPIFHQSYQALKEKGIDIHLLNYAFEEMMVVASKSIDYLNKSLINQLKDNGTMISISDIFEADITSPFYLKLSKDIHHPSKMDAHLKEYQNKFGYGAGDFGVENLEEYLNPVTHQWLIWPFSEQAHFFVKLTIFKK